jgi:hypothetical protein
VLFAMLISLSAGGDTPVWLETRPSTIVRNGQSAAESM